MDQLDAVDGLFHLLIVLSNTHLNINGSTYQKITEWEGCSQWWVGQPPIIALSNTLPTHPFPTSQIF